MTKKTPLERCRAAFTAAIATALGEPPEEVSKYVCMPEAGQLVRDKGDISFPTFHLAKSRQTAPNLIATKLAAEAKADGLVFEAMGAYVNAWFDFPSFARGVIDAATVEGPAYGTTSTGEGKTVVIDYSSPNIAKPIAYHHIRSTVLGNALARLHRAHGWKVEGINYLGDWGTQFGMVAVGVELTPGLDARDASVEMLVEAYVKAARAAEVNDDERSILPRARAFFVRMENGDEGALALWRSIRDRSIESFKRVYARLGISFDHYEGESRYDRTRTSATIDEIARTVGVKESQGALIADIHSNPPIVLRKTDGSSLYVTRDIAAAIDRYDRFKFDRSLYVVALDQYHHFAQVFGTLLRMGKPWVGDCDHVGFGRVHGMSTRYGRTILLEHVLDEAVARAREKALERTPDKIAKLRDLDEVARAVGIGAIIFNDLRNRRETDYEFDWDRILDFEGDTGPYVQYAHARACNILRKGGRTTDYDATALCTAEEKAVVHAIAGFPEAMSRAIIQHEYDVSLVVRQLLLVASTFARWYAAGNDDAEKRILCTNPRQLNARLALTEAVQVTLAAGLDVIGVAAPTMM
jgi:arginyl-tRNA synthetase